MSGFLVAERRGGRTPFGGREILRPETGQDRFRGIAAKLLRGNANDGLRLGGSSARAIHICEQVEYRLSIRKH